MKEQIATFHTHLGAVRFHKILKDLGDSAVMMPVPRKLSASCGTCVRFSHPFEEGWVDEDLEAVYNVKDGGFELVFFNEEQDD